MASKQSGRQSRRMACILCRERKVKCDGGRPSCERCSKAEETCTYSIYLKASKAEMQEHIQQLSERIDQAESSQAKILAQQQNQLSYLCQSPFALDAHFSAPLMTSKPPGIEDQKPPLPAPADEPSLTGSPMNGLCEWNKTNTGPAPFHSAGQIFPLDGSTDYGEPTKAPLDTNGGIITPFSADQDVMDASSYLTHSVDLENTVADAAPTFLSPPLSINSQLPSLRDVRERKQSAPVAQSKDSSRAGEDADEATAQLLQEFISLVNVAALAQHNIIGVANTVAEYSEYFRQPGSAGPRNIKGLASFLETLEYRMREISNIASQQVLQQAHSAQEAIGAHPAYQSQMADLEDELGQRTRARSEFFGSVYDLSRPLSQQT